MMCAASPQFLVHTIRLMFVLSIFLIASGCGKEPAKPPPTENTIHFADDVYLNGRLYTVDADNSWAQAMAVSSGKIIMVGSDEEAEKHIGDATRVHDLDQQMVMPGIHDMHAHPKEAGEMHNFQCAFPFTFNMEQIIAKLTNCAEATPEGEWIRGGQWDMGLMESATVPHKDILDAITTEHPIYLGDSTVHGAWVNSLGLEKLGIDSATPNPQGGVIVREIDGREPTGILIDSAAYAVLKNIPAYSEAQYEKALLWSMAEMNKVGVTALKDAIADSHALKAYRSLDQAGRLNMKISTSIGWKMAWSDSAEKERENLENRAQFASKNVNTDFTKIMLDGIPPARTSALLEPYVADELHGDQFLGKLIHSPEQLTEDLIFLDGMGLTAKIHATGDRSVRVSLDAIEAARKANPGSTLMHEISHAELIHPDDIPRFKALNVTAELCPIMWYPTTLVAVMEQIIGEERANHFWPIKSLNEAGAHLIYGSDWPSVVPDPNPWPGIEAMVTRKDPYGVQPGALWPEQAIDLESTIRIFTINGAIAAKHEDKTGSLESGKSADFIILDHNIFEVPVEQISETRIISTVVAGIEVYTATP